MKIITNKHEKKIYAGISFDDKEQIHFDFNHDNASDEMYLYQNTSGEFNNDNIKYVYGYHFNPNIDKRHKSKIRNMLKSLSPDNHLFEEYVDKFVEEGVLNFDADYNLNSFDAIVSIESTSNNLSLVDVMHGYFMEYSDCPWYDFGLLKKMYRDVQFDSNKAYQALKNSGLYKNEKDITDEIEFTLHKFEDLKSSDQLFQMKRFIPKEIRSSFHDFLKFKDDDERELYALLQNANVLIYDDFMTSGSTVKEIARYLRSINDSNTLTVFVLVKQ